MFEGERGIGRAEASVAIVLAALVIVSVVPPPTQGLRAPSATTSSPRLLSARGLERAIGSTAPAPPGIAAGPPTGLHFDYLVMIVLENKGICDILTTCGGSAPYLTNLANESGLATHYVKCTFPSLPNYLCLTSADTFGCTTDGAPHSNPCTDAAWNATNVVDRLEGANLTWKAYMEDMPKDCDPSNAGLYVVRHDPFVYYSDIATNATRCARVVPSGANGSVLVSDLGSPSTASNFMWFTPNRCHDMHDCNVSSEDAYFAGLVPKILNSSVFQTQRAALLIAFDEDANGRGAPDLYTVWAGPAAKRAYRSAASYNHYSALHTIEANWGLAPLNGNDTRAPTMDEFFPSDRPVARFFFTPAWPRPNATATFNASSSSDSNPNGTLQYRWDWTHDGVWDTGWSTTPTADHMYPEAGVFTAALEVRDSGGVLNSTTEPVPVDGAPPVTTASRSGPAGLDGWYVGPVTVTLTATDDLSGVNATDYRVDGGPIRTYRTPIVVGGDGTHTVAFRSEDRARNVEAWRDASFRIDSVAPATNATFSGTLDGDVFVAPIGVALTATDALSGVRNTSYAIDGNWAGYASPFEVSNVGSHEVQFYSVDRAGNVEPTTAFAVVNGTIRGVALRSRAILNGTAGSSGWFRSAVAVTLDLVNGTSPPDSINYRLDGGTWTRYHVPFLVSGDGVHSLDFNATDGAGLNEVVRHLRIGIDTTPPASRASVSGRPGDGGWYVSNATVSLNATDATSGVAALQYRLDNGTWSEYTGPFVLTEGRHMVEFNATDVAGLKETVHRLGVNVDTTPPETVASVSGSLGKNGWYVSRATVSLAATDATSGVAKLQYRTDGGAWLEYAGPFVLSDGRHVVEYYATDVAGLTDAVHTQTVNVDSIPPTSSAAVSAAIGNDGWFISNATVLLSASDATSGVAAILYRVDGGPWTPYAGAIVLRDGVHQIDYYAVDVAGLSEATHSLPVRVDTTPPTTHAAASGRPGSNGWFVSNVTVFLNASDGMSGVANLSYRIDGGPWQPYRGRLVLGDGRYRIEYFATDIAGVVEAVHSMDLAIDRTPPTTAAFASGTLGDLGWYTSEATLALTASDATSGVDAISVRVDGGPWQTYGGAIVLGSGRHQVDFFATDLAGLAGGIQSVAVDVDTASPAITEGASGTPGANGWFTSEVSVALSATDSLSGVATLEYRIDGGAWVLYAGPIRISTGGVHVLEYVATDLAGNLAYGQVALSIDPSPPTFQSISPSGTAFGSPVRIVWVASDGESGIADYEVGVDGGPFQPLGLVNDALLELSDGHHTIQVKAINHAGLATIETVSVEVVSSREGSVPSPDPLPIVAIAAVMAAGVALGIWRFRYGRRPKSP